MNERAVNRAARRVRALYHAEGLWGLSKRYKISHRDDAFGRDDIPFVIACMRKAVIEEIRSAK